MSDLISRQAAIDAIEMVDWYHQNQHKEMVSGANNDEHQAWYKAEDVYEAIEALPSAKPKTGEWKYKLMKGDKVKRVCGRCGWSQSYDNRLYVGYRYKYCPNCGALMEGEQVKGEGDE